ncbi:Starch-binding associating with outer membrane [Hymenobacter daecheongensis DSM 21074]|uniref:Starch-binding associating with outer membrane n=1 Tax=Hymenobacter daecheongensis DSM 21074 TaxID=1121955 RepID=A0A1M6CCT2_9BACT|nr:SusD/RagB family nutrient-binding outer membrane lipoprotein [Hymenobacter daecheongensis]SHI58865.1 Starch-binding associating with outer membrane [Hymenobacter daecheongensis DSM 21074]
MNTYRKASIAVALVGLLATNTGCSDFFKVNVDPLNPSAARLSDLLPVTQVAMGTYLGFSVNGLSQPTAALMQQLSTTRGIGTFQQNGDSFTNQWSGLYADMLINNEQIIKQGTAEQAWGYVGIAQLQKAYVVSQMVDMWGDLPYSEGLLGTANKAPKFDKDSEIYADLFRLIDEGVANLAKTSARTPGGEDLMYGGSMSAWSHFGRTLKLKLYNQIRLTRDVSSDVRALLATPDNLLLSNEDFELKYGASTQPDNRNLGYIGDYVNSGRENTIGRYFFELMNTNRDPRIPYYFYNQATGTVAIADYQNGNFVTVKFGSTGANASANNTGVRTLPGLYPVGGRFDAGKGGNADATYGKGTVAQRLLTFFSRKFTEAELQLTVLNNPTAARTAYEEGVRASFKKLNDIAQAEGIPNAVKFQAAPELVPIIPETDPNTSKPSISKYVAEALLRFDRATTTNGRLNAIMTEKYIASFGFGLDAYTDFRRTGYPNITVPDRADNAGPVNPSNPAPGTVDDNDPQTVGQGSFPRRLTYQLSELQINPNAPREQPDVVSTRIFWDKR